MNKALEKQRAFTLIELLVVVAIIGLLMGLLFPAISKVMLTTRRNQARGDTLKIATAINTYWNDYTALPVVREADNTYGNEEAAAYLTEEVSKAIIEVLIGENVSLNPREKVYLGTSTVDADGTFLDPWNRQYYIKLDRDLNMKIEYGNVTGRHGVRAVVVSAGPDGDILTQEDNVANVEFLDD